MSSVVLWHDPVTGVNASWNKQGAHSVFVPTYTDAEHTTHGNTTHHIDAAAAVRKARAVAKAKRAEMTGELPPLPTYRRQR